MHIRATFRTLYLKSLSATYHFTNTIFSPRTRPFYPYTFLSTTFQRSIVSVQYLKGTYHVLFERKYLSPLNGAALDSSGALKLLYDYPNPSNKKTFEVVKNLFYKNQDQLKDTQLKSLPAYSLTPVLIGHILHYLSTRTLTSDVRKKIKVLWRKQHKLVTGNFASSQRVDDFFNLLSESQNECDENQFPPHMFVL